MSKERRMSGKLTMEIRHLEGVGGYDPGGDAAPIAAANHRHPVPGRGFTTVATADIEESFHCQLLLRLVGVDGWRHLQRQLRDIRRRGWRYQSNLLALVRTAQGNAKKNGRRHQCQPSRRHFHRHHHRHDLSPPSLAWPDLPFSIHSTKASVTCLYCIWTGK